MVHETSCRIAQIKPCDLRWARRFKYLPITGEGWKFWGKLGVKKKPKGKTSRRCLLVPAWRNWPGRVEGQGSFHRRCRNATRSAAAGAADETGPTPREAHHRDARDGSCDDAQGDDACDAADDMGTTPLMAVAAQGHAHVVRLLLEVRECNGMQCNVA